MQDIERQTVDARPNCTSTTFSCLYDAVAGNMQCGRDYLFDTAKYARDYSRWGTHEFRVTALEKC